MYTLVSQELVFTEYQRVILGNITEMIRLSFLAFGVGNS